MQKIADQLRFEAKFGGSTLSEIKVEDWMKGVANESQKALRVSDELITGTIVYNVINSYINNVSYLHRYFRSIIPLPCVVDYDLQNVLFKTSDFAKDNVITVSEPEPFYSDLYSVSLSFIITINAKMYVKEQLKESFKEVSKREDILQRAIQTVCHDRQDQYGNPEDSAETIAMLWSAYLQGKGKNCCVNAVDVDLMMALLKIGREVHGHKDDNMVDLAGYASLAAECYSKSEEGRVETLYSEEGDRNGGPTN